MPVKNKKQLDIIPPQASESFQQYNSNQPAREPKEKRSPFFFLLVLFIIIILAAAMAYFFIPHKAEITVWPRTERVGFEVEQEIYGQLLREERVSPEKFYSFDKKETETRAEGIIRIHNDFHLDQILIPDTRFWCRGEEALEFKIKERVTIPAKAYLDVEAIASLPGKELNIGPCKTFSVPGLAGTPRYTAVYGESLEPMRGGDSFTEVLAVEKAELENIAREYVLEQIDQNQRIEEGSLGVSHSLSSSNLEEQKIVLLLQITASIYTVPDEERLKMAFRGTDSQRIKELIGDFPEVNELSLKLWPFWANRVPEDLTRIDIKLNI